MKSKKDHGNRDRFREALGELIRISRAVGADPDLVQGGGGNTSVKTRHGRSILVKASGTSLAEMDEGRGWAELGLDEVRSLLAVPGLSRLPQARRESEVLRLLAGAVRRPAGARPSVESNLHALLDRVVIHTHPVGLGAFLCSKGSRARWRSLLRGIPGEPLYVPYTDPGYILASRLDEEIGRYRARHGRPPSVVLLENHGVFVAAGEAGAALALSKRVTDLGRRFIGGGRVNPVEFPALADRGGDPALAPEPRVRAALLRGGCAPVLVRRDTSALAARFVGDPAAVRAARRGAFTPDQIVYCRTYPLFLDPRGGGRTWEAAVREYRKARKMDPRVVIVPGKGILYAAADLPGLRIVTEVYRAAMTTILRSRRAGGPRFLDRRQAGFIEGWEVEAFRARLAAGAGKPLKGRAALVVGAASPGGEETAKALAGAGATVVAVDRDRKALAGLGRRLGRSCTPFIWPDDTDRIFETVAASFGGLDIHVDARLQRAVLGLLGKGGTRSLDPDLLLHLILLDHETWKIAEIQGRMPVRILVGADGSGAEPDDRRLPTVEVCGRPEEVLRAVVARLRP